MVVVIVSVEDHRDGRADLPGDSLAQPIRGGRELGINHQQVVAVFDEQRVAATGQNGAHAGRKINLGGTEISMVEPEANASGGEHQKQEENRQPEGPVSPGLQFIPCNLSFAAIDLLQILRALQGSVLNKSEVCDPELPG